MRMFACRISNMDGIAALLGGVFAAKAAHVIDGQNDKLNGQSHHHDQQKDFKKPRNDIHSRLFKMYTLNIIPKIGKIIANDEESYRYLGESIQTYFSPNEINNMLIESGFIRTRIINLLEDVATIHIGYKS